MLMDYDIRNEPQKRIISTSCKEEFRNMLRNQLNENWTLTVLGKNVYDIPETPVDTTVPSTVYSTLLDHGLMPDPYYRDNELRATRLMENDFVYETTFTLSTAQREADRIFLRFEGIDTIADVSLDGTKLGSADNMNRVWEFDITAHVTGDPEETVYHLSVTLHSPTRYIAEAQNEIPVGGSDEAMPGFGHIRKAACMYGWDWGPRLPDAGLFRPVTIDAVKTARISQVYLRQEHEITGTTVHGNTVSRVRLTADTEIEWMPEAQEELLKAVLLVTTPDGSTTLSAESTPADSRRTAPSKPLTGLNCDLRSSHVTASVVIEDPALWWPNGYGAQPLYTVSVLLVPADTESAAPLDTWHARTGLRTVTVNTDPLPGEIRDPHMTGQEPDYEDGINLFYPEGDHMRATVARNGKKVEGRNFALEVNGLQIFAMGADYVPEDSLLPRTNRERTDLLLTTAQESHFNCIRIWGGGYFLDDFFYDLCDEKGILIWQDNMFACAAYDLTDAFIRNLDAEIRTNMRRLRSHPCIGLWCGNNELETQYEGNAWPRTRKQFYDYIRLYEYIIPEITKEEDPSAFYWPSSPSSGGNFENSNAENVGDTHYWGVWHGNEPFTAYRKHHYRFLSEFGFQAFPSYQTICRFTEPEDRNIFSRIMEMHQRNTAANGKILNYIAQTYLYPKNFKELLYCSQILQANAIRYGVEHFRRFRGTSMGVTVWQLNDIWPVASWASVDYYGNWKALQYAEKKMFAPVLLSCEEHGQIDQKPNVNTLPIPVDYSADLHVANETAEEVSGTVRWSLRNPDSSVIREGTFKVTVPAYGGTWLPHLDFNDQDPLRMHLSYAFETGGAVVSEGTTLFCAPKHYEFLDPELSVSVNGDEVTVTAANYAQAVSIETPDGVLRLSDNFFDMEKGSKTVKILPSRDFTEAGDALHEADPEGGAAIRDVRNGKLRARSIYETADRE